MGYHIKGDKPSEKRVPLINQNKKDKSDFSLDEFITDAIEHQKTTSKILQLNFAAFETVQSAVNVLLNKKREVRTEKFILNQIVQKFHKMINIFGSRNRSISKSG